MPIPLFVCHSNCCRSVLAHYLYEKLCDAGGALSAGVEAGDEINNRADAMLRWWGIDASGHRPRQLDRFLCDRGDAIFVMSPRYLARILAEYGRDLASKCYLFEDPCRMPVGFENGEYRVSDPSLDPRPVSELVAEFSWFRSRILEIGAALNHREGGFVPASRYLKLLENFSRKVSASSAVSPSC